MNPKGFVKIKVSLRLEGVPANWSNARTGRGEPFESKHQLWAAKATWKQLAAFVARSKANSERLPRPSAQDKKRRVAITLYRRRLLDPDGAYASIKPVLDGLKGILLYDDSPRYCELLVTQLYPQDQPLETEGRECTWITVDLEANDTEAVA